MSNTSPTKRLVSASSVSGSPSKRAKETMLPTPDISPIDGETAPRPGQATETQPSLRDDITIADFKTAIAGWNFQLSDNEQSEDAIRTAWRTMFLTIYHTDKGADTVSRQNFMLSHKLFYRLDQTLVYFRYSSEDMALVLFLFVDRFGVAFHSSLYPLDRDVQSSTYPLRWEIPSCLPQPWTATSRVSLPSDPPSIFRTDTTASPSLTRSVALTW
ncbi:hypothetical protein B0T12DRAFT_501341 [Alternaria alternata]|jgi:hypothetical protein|nr:hypothetical protein B0T12DRAFT_501341 [Alternaria alternata]